MRAQSTGTEPCTPRTAVEDTNPLLATERARTGDGHTVCRDCSKSWTGFKPEHCMSCHHTFGGTDAGDRHRVGKFNDPDDPRRCLDPVEAGLKLSKRGIWISCHSRDRK